MSKKQAKTVAEPAAQKLRVHEAADLASVSKKTVHRWIASGMLRATHVRRPGTTRGLVLVDAQHLKQLLGG